MNIEQIRNAVSGQVIWDNDGPSSVKGLHLRVTPSNAKNFMFYYRTKQGQQRRPKLGEFGEITLAEARSIAKKMSLEVAAGGDPMGTRGQSKSELKVKELYELVLKEHWSKPNYIKSGWLKQVKNNWKVHLLPAFGEQRLSDLSPLTVRAWHKGLEETPYAANRSLEVLSKMFNWAEGHGATKSATRTIREPGTNPCRQVKAHPEKKRSRYATDEELRKLVPILDHEYLKYPRAITFLKALMFTGGRPRFLEQAEWSQLSTFQKDGETHGVIVGAGKSTEKTGDDEILILPPQVMELLGKLPRMPNGRIFGIKNPVDHWTRIRAEAGCADLWARDFRRFFASVGMSNGVSKDQIGRLLNHHSSQTTDIYAKLIHDSRVVAAGAIARQIDKIVENGMSEASQ